MPPPVFVPHIRWGDERLGGGRIRADKYVKSRAWYGLITLHTALCLAADCQGVSGGGGLSASVACHSEDKHQLAATPVTPTLPSGVSRLHLRSWRLVITLDGGRISSFVLFFSWCISCGLRPLIPATSLLGALCSDTWSEYRSTLFFSSFHLPLSALALCRRITVMEGSAVHNDIHSTCLPGKSDLIIGMLLRSGGTDHILRQGPLVQE